MANASVAMNLLKTTPQLGYAAAAAGGALAGAQWSRAVKNKKLAAGVLRAYRHMTVDGHGSDDESEAGVGGDSVDGSAVEKSGAAVNMEFARNLARFVSVCVPGVRSKEAGMVAAIAVLLGARSWLDLWTSSNGGHVVRAIVARNKQSFLKYAVRDIGIMMIPCAVVNNSLRYSLSRLKMMWRRRLSMYFYQKYLSNNVFYKVNNLDSRIKNIDQLLTADVDRFCTSLADLYSNLSKPSIDIFLTSRKLAQSLGPEGPMFMIAYFMLCSALLRTVQPPFGDLAVTEQKLEGALRLRSMRLSLHSEEISFYNGSGAEGRQINQAFDRYRDHAYKMFAARWKIGLFDAVLVKYIATIVGYSVVSIPIFFSDAKFFRLLVPKLLGKASAQVGDSEDGAGGESASDIAGQYTRNSRLLLQLASAIGRLVLAGKEVQRLTGFTNRIAKLRDVLDDMAQSDSVQRRFESSPDLQRDIELARLMKPGKLVIGSEDDGPEANIIRFVGVNLISPDSVPLATNLTFEIHRGCHVLLTGPNGCGKSSLFRLIAGLWPIYAGTLYRPGGRGAIFYVPQKPYCALGTLRDNIIYPLSWREAVEQCGATDARLIELLEQVHLSELLKRKGGLDSICDWKSSLSGGQAQRLAFSRLLFHRPSYAILDECTSQVSLDVEGLLYEHAKACGITLISVSHRPSLWKYHDKKLAFFGDGAGYEFGDIHSGEIPSMMGASSSLSVTPP